MTVNAKQAGVSGGDSSALIVPLIKLELNELNHLKSNPNMI